MGNTNAKPLPRPRNKKQVHWKAADRPAPPGKPALIATPEASISDALTIRWDPPSKDGGSPITGYLVEYRRFGSSNWLRATQMLITYPELDVKGLEAGWRYQFRVFAENAVGMSDPSPLSDPMTMMFQKSDITAPRFLEELKDSVALENDKIEFVVHYVGQPPPKVSWYKDGFEIFSSRRTRIITENDRSLLLFHQSAMSDEGEIKCTITNRAGHASTRALLNLEAPPSIRLPRQYEEGLLFEIGEMIRLKVSIAGRPMPLVFWSQNGESIQNDERYEIENTDRTSVLRVGEAKRSDRGEYQIKAVNKLGEDIVSFLVTVTDKPSPPGRARVVMTLGRSVTLSWKTPNDDGGCKIGNYIVEYFRLGWNVWLKAATTRQLTTILGDLIEGSEYKFRIKAESPYGVSEPSEESETVFIPDPKRGILAPAPRSRSQQRETPPTTPVAAKRKKRSQSSNRNEDNYGNPVRPERIKTKSTPSTPEPSPRVHRKMDANGDLLNKQLFDRASMARELAYGSPEIRVKKVENLFPEESKPPRSRSRSPSPIKQIAAFLRKSRSPSPGKFRKSPSPSPSLEQRQKARKESDLGGSSEFMLVLYPEDNAKGPRETSVMSFDLDDVPIAPPLSLSAPELGAEPPPIEYIKLSASSTELLHERAMIRFYEQAAAEEAEIQKLKERQLTGERRQSVIPKIQINSKDDEDIVGLEKKHSLRRRLSAGGAMPQQVLWAQRRHSLRNSNEIQELGDSRLYKFPVPLDANKIKKLKEEEFKRHAKLEEENLYDEVEGTDYEEMSDDESYEARYKKYEDEVPQRRFDEEDETYHPRAMILKKSEEPFEILTKPNKLPDPSFIPKPILKKRDGLQEEAVKDIRLDPGYISRERSKSLAGDQLQEAANAFKAFNTNEEATGGSRQRSYSLIPTTDDTPVPLPDRRGSIATGLIGLGQTVAAVASISGIAAAGFVIPNTLLNKQKDEEEAKVVIDHYGDIVNTFNQQRRRSSFTPSPDFEQKAVNNIFSVRQMQKQQSVDEKSYEKLVEKSSLSLDLKNRRDSLTLSSENVNKSSESVNKSNESLEDKKSDSYKRRMEYMNRIAESKTQEIPGESVKAWDRTMETIRKSEEKKLGDSWEDLDSNLRKKNSLENLRSKEEVREKENMARFRESKSRTDSKSPVQRSSSTTPTHRQEGRRLRKASPSPNLRTRKASPSPASNFKRISTSSSSKTPSPANSPSQSHKSVFATTTTQRPPSSTSYTRSSSISRSTSISPPPSSSISKSPSPIHLKRPPMMREIMTQTSNAIDPYKSRGMQTSTHQEELTAQAKVVVKNSVEYVTDLVLFFAACYLYLFSNELLVIPILVIMIYRQLKDAIKDRMPKWLKRKPKDTNQ